MNKVATVIAVILVCLIVGLGISQFTNFSIPYWGNLESLSLGVTPYDYAAIAYVADEQGMFAQNGLQVTLQDYGTTVQAMDGLATRQVDLAFTTEYVVVSGTFKKENINIVASVDKYQAVYLAARKDKGIQNFTDLKGKKIGLSVKTIGEFYLGRFLTLHGINMREVTLVDAQPTEYVSALTSGKVDAMVAVNTFVDQMRDQLGNDLIAWPVQSNQNGFYVLTSGKNWLAQHTQTAQKLVRALEQSESYIAQHPAEAKAIVQKRLGLDAAYMDTVWSQNQFSLSLDQSLILAMEDEARWMIANNLTTETQVPNFTDYIYDDALKQVKPNAVNIIR